MTVQPVSFLGRLVGTVRPHTSDYLGIHHLASQLAAVDQLTSIGLPKLPVLNCGMFLCVIYHHRKGSDRVANLGQGPRRSNVEDTSQALQHRPTELLGKSMNKLQLHVFFWQTIAS